MKRKDIEIEKICAMCEHSEDIFDGENVLCHRKGVVPATYKCRRFSYDILKRVPPATPKVAPMDFIDIDTPT